MSTIVLYEDALHIPDGITTLAVFRRWFRADDFPEAGLVCFLHGQPWVDMSKEQIFTHNQVKQEFNLVLKEYWLVDARDERPKFTILRSGSSGYVAARKQGGWIKSRVFGRSFRFTRRVDDAGNPEFTLSVRRSQ